MIVLNPIAGGGLSSTKLSLATASAADVLSGKTFYAGGKVIKTGTLVPTGKFATGTIPKMEGTNATTTITLGFKPQLILVKTSTLSNTSGIIGYYVSNSSFFFEFGYSYPGEASNFITITSDGFIVKNLATTHGSSLGAFYTYTNVPYYAVG